jgi:hypothetical protein
MDKDVADDMVTDMAADDVATTRQMTWRTVAADGQPHGRWQGIHVRWQGVHTTNVNAATWQMTWHNDVITT